MKKSALSVAMVAGYVHWKTDLVESLKSPFIMVSHNFFFRLGLLSTVSHYVQPVCTTYNLHNLPIDQKHLDSRKYNHCPWTFSEYTHLLQ